ncbi:hypothetical protein UK23_31090 [Lentzea aerocolonigenes]|uniref:Putative adhesin Stv domain-containing protein n=1 Tax=Lentzea aerocolonigenes TaxID=68170 RepID=A0A0F0GL27_LENAE|nr:hypothetical protein [Lentzea aerocolonigenes]KJK43995.1 hypothetical protein UK23_31090 [Lentzea aerocolonigenes]
MKRTTATDHRGPTMTTAFVLGHGGRKLSYGKTFVPEGRTLTFCSLDGEYTAVQRGLEMMVAGQWNAFETWDDGKAEVLDVLAATPGAPCPEVHNYSLAPLTDQEKNFFARMARRPELGAVPLYQVGEDVRAGQICTAGCSRRNRVHAKECAGIFNLVAEDHIVMVNCRQLYEREVLAAAVPSLRPDVRAGGVLADYEQVAIQITQLIENRQHLRAWQALVALPDATRALVEASSVPIKEFMAEAGRRARTGANRFVDPDRVTPRSLRPIPDFVNAEQGWRAHVQALRAGSPTGAPPLPKDYMDCVTTFQNLFVLWLQEGSAVSLALYHLVLMVQSEPYYRLGALSPDVVVDGPAAVYAFEEYAEHVTGLWAGGETETALGWLGLSDLATYAADLRAEADGLMTLWQAVCDEQARGGSADADKAEFVSRFEQARLAVQTGFHARLYEGLEHVLVPAFRDALRSVTEDNVVRRGQF